VFINQQVVPIKLQILTLDGNNDQMQNGISNESSLTVGGIAPSSVKLIRGAPAKTFTGM
jgi:hypothetical protein